MKRMKRSVIALLLCAALLSGLLTTASGASNIYFMAVNETVVEMTPENMPIMVGGTLYVPYVMLSGRDSGINLGVTAQYSPNRRTVLVSSRQMGVIFNPQTNSCQDLEGNSLPVHAVVRNAMVYIPLAWVCEYFGTISYSTTRMSYGMLVRVTNSSAILSDAEFIDAAGSILRDNYNRYLSSVGGSNPGQSGQGPAVSTPPESGPLVYMAFRAGEKTDEVAQLLERYEQWGLFLFTAEQMIQQDDMIRRLIGKGHMVGLEAVGNEAEECTAEVENGRRLLAEIARSALTIVSAPNADKQGKAELKQSGCALWEASVAAEDVAVNQLIRALSEDEVNYLEFICDGYGLTVLSANLPAVAGTGYRLHQAVAPVL